MMVFDQSIAPTFSGIDYALLILVLVTSTLIGLYYGLFRSGDNSPEDYFLGSRSMGILPVAVSLLVTFVSGISIIGLTADVYAHGTHHWFSIVTNFMMIIITAFIFLPVFYELQLPSIFIYLKLRFGRKLQLLASFMYFVSTTFYVSVNLYIPALVINYMTGISIVLACIVLGSVCMFYTAIGGFRAVIWTDMFQTVLILACCLTITIIGIDLAGGVDRIWEASQRGGRVILFELDPNPTIRLTTWSMIFGNTILTTQQFGLNQASIQRFLSMSSLTRARSVLLLFYLGFSCLLLLSMATALIIYAYYEDCDPLTAKLISKLDQLVPFFVSELSENFPGLQGLFVAGIVAGSLSTMSSCLNSSTVCFYEDFMKPLLPTMSQQKTCTFLKLLTFALGCLQIALVFVVERIGTIFKILITLQGLTCGTMLGLFTIGVLLPKANQKGAISGALTSLVVVGIIIIGGFSKKPDPHLLMRTDGCLNNSTMTFNDLEGNSEDNSLWIFRISFMYYSTVGFVLVCLIGYAVSLLTGGNRITDQRLLAPFLRRKYSERFVVDDAIDQEILNKFL